MQWTSAPNIGEAPLPQRARGYWKTRFSALHEGLEKLLEAERAQLPPWFVVGFGSGIAAWFALDAQRQWAAFLCMAAALALDRLRAWQRTRGAGARLVRARGDARLRAGVGALGLGRAAAARPAGGHRRRRPGRIGRLSRRQGHGPADGRDLSDAELCRRASGSRSTRTSFPPGIAPGAQIRVRARLAPPPPMALPGTYDFARDAWFKGIGAVGKALGPVTVVQPAQPHGLDRARDGLRAAYQRAAARELGGNRDRARHRRPECGRPGRRRRDAAKRPHAPAVGQRPAHRRGGRLRDAAQPQAARAERAAGAALQPGARLGRASRRRRASATPCSPARRCRRCEAASRRC